MEALAVATLVRTLRFSIYIGIPLQAQCSVFLNHNVRYTTQHNVDFTDLEAAKNHMHQFPSCAKANVNDFVVRMLL